MTMNGDHWLKAVAQGPHRARPAKAQQAGHARWLATEGFQT